MRRKTNHSADIWPSRITDSVSSSCRTGGSAVVWTRERDVLHVISVPAKACYVCTKVYVTYLLTSHKDVLAVLLAVHVTQKVKSVPIISFSAKMEPRTKIKSRNLKIKYKAKMSSNRIQRLFTILNGITRALMGRQIPPYHPLKTVQKNATQKLLKITPVLVFTV